jgi:hypothetical protein
MATRVWESAVLAAPIDSAWDALRPMSFAFNPNVASAAIEDGKSASEVGAVAKITYKDKTVQRLKISEISDATHSLSWEMIESIPAIPFMSVAHTIKLRRVTENNSTFIEWVADFSKDADNNALADARFKQKENFTALGTFLQTKPGSNKLGREMKGVFSPEKAKEGVLQIWKDLNEVHKLSGTDLSKDGVNQARASYMKLPTTWQLNWKLADLSGEVAQKLADEARDRINAKAAKQGNNALPLPRLFQVA